MKSVLFVFIFSVNVYAFPSTMRNPYITLLTDPCLAVVKKAVATVEFSSNNTNRLTDATLLSTRDERSYDLKFSGLAGSYELILDNDRSNKCFLIQQKFNF